MKILIADDELSICRALENILTKEGYEVEFAVDGEDACEKAEVWNPDLLLLDIMMPKKNGFDVCEHLREQGNHVPVIMLSAKGDIVDKSIGFKMGADDYIVKPFEPEELRLRVHAQLRRRSYEKDAGPAPVRGAAGLPKDIELVEAGDLKIFLDRYQVLKRGHPVKLTTKEFEVLALLASNAGSVFTREEILSFLWDGDNDKDLNSVTVFVRRIREKIEDNPSKPEYILTVWMVGYKFRAD